MNKDEFSNKVNETNITNMCNIPDIGIDSLSNLI